MGDHQNGSEGLFGKFNYMASSGLGSGPRPKAKAGSLVLGSCRTGALGVLAIGTTSFTFPFTTLASPAATSCPAPFLSSGSARGTPSSGHSPASMRWRWAYTLHAHSPSLQAGRSFLLPLFTSAPPVGRFFRTARDKLRV